MKFFRPALLVFSCACSAVLWQFFDHPTRRLPQAAGRVGWMDVDGGWIICYSISSSFNRNKTCNCIHFFLHILFNKMLISIKYIFWLIYDLQKNPISASICSTFCFLSSNRYLSAVTAAQLLFRASWCANVHTCKRWIFTWGLKLTFFVIIFLTTCFVTTWSHQLSILLKQKSRSLLYGEKILRLQLIRNQLNAWRLDTLCTYIYPTWDRRRAAAAAASCWLWKQPRYLRLCRSSQDRMPL